MSDLTHNPAATPSVRPFASEEPTAVPAFHPIPDPEGETAFFPATPDEPPAEPSARIPHLGHALLFLAIAAVILLLTQVVDLGLTHPAVLNAKPAVLNAKTAISPKLLIASEAFTYLATLAIAALVFPLLWQKPFAIGIQANPDAARRNALRLVPIGLTLSFAVQAISSLATMPKDIPMDDFFRTPSDIWIVTVFGIFLAPLFEEILFRGFLVPAFAIAYDWLSLPRTPAAREQWNSSNRLTPASLVFSAVLTSILFAALHGQQVAFAWPVLVLLFVVSLILCYVRIRLRSVIASTVIHASYNFTIFLTAFVATGGYRHLDKMAR